MAFFLTLGEVIRVLAVLPRVELGRRRQGTRGLIGALRRRGAAAAARGADQRQRLRRAIGLVDAACLKRNCLRRALLEVALDAGAAAEPLNLGFRKEGPRLTGHAWLGADNSPAQDFPAQFHL
jgi:Transglutaminase-like superfamily